MVHHEHVYPQSIDEQIIYQDDPDILASLPQCTPEERDADPTIIQKVAERMINRRKLLELKNGTEPITLWQSKKRSVVFLINGEQQVNVQPARKTRTQKEDLTQYSPIPLSEAKEGYRAEPIAPRSIASAERNASEKTTVLVDNGEESGRMPIRGGIASPVLAKELFDKTHKEESEPKPEVDVLADLPW